MSKNFHLFSVKIVKISPEPRLHVHTISVPLENITPPSLPVKMVDFTTQDHFVSGFKKKI